MVNNSEVVAVGVGSAGIRIASLLSRKQIEIDRFAYVSCDRSDFSTVDQDAAIEIESPIDQKLTPAIVRGLAFASLDKIRAAIGGSKVVLVIAGLGGATGSGLAPLVASIAREAGSKVVGVAVMPFEFEKKMKFYAGVSLRRLRGSSLGVIVIDNDTLLNASSEDSTLATLYDSANKAAVRALGSLLSKTTEGSRAIGLGKILGAVAGRGYSLLGVSSGNGTDRAEDALAGAVVSIGKVAETKQAERTVVNLSGDSSLSVKEVGLVVDRVGSIMDNEAMEVEYAVDQSGSSQLQVALLASGFRATKYDDYDPLSQVLGDRILDDEADVSLAEGLEALQPCD